MSTFDDEAHEVGKTVVITGAAKGIGRAFAEGFSRDGWTVVAGDVDDAGLKSLSEDVRTRTTDVSSEADVRALVDYAVEATGRIDVLFNNAGYGLPYSVEEMPEGAFEKLVAVHLFGALYGTRAAIPRMKRQGMGHIVNTLSRAGEFHGPRASAYNAAKAAQWALTRTAAYELRGTGVLVNGLVPGPTNSSIWGVDRPDLQPPEAVYPHARFMASFGPDGPTGRVYWDSQEYVFGASENAARLPGRSERS